MHVASAVQVMSTALLSNYPFATMLCMGLTAYLEYPLGRSLLSVDVNKILFGTGSPLDLKVPLQKMSLSFKLVAVTGGM
jgi:hypothetical protein